MVRSFECQKDVFDNIVCASTVLDNPYTAAFEIDRVFEALKRYKQPIYIELPRDVADKPISYDLKLGTPRPPQSDPENLSEALADVAQWLETAENPIILAGIEISRFQLGEQLLKFAERNHIPIVTTLLSKSVVSERHPLFMGVYSGKMTEETLRERVEGSDCLLCLGVLMTDFTLGFMPSRFKKRRKIYSFYF
jgi:indolepyruvate decarboxylase